MDWKIDGNGVLFLSAGAKSAVVQMRLAEGRAEERGEAVWLAHDEIARLEPWELAALGLPSSAPVRLEIRGEGTLTSPGFRLHCQLRSHDNRRLLGVKRNGSFLQIGKRSYVLLDPLYTVLKEVELFQENSSTDMDERFLAWARLKESLPEDVQVDDYLQTITLVRADGFTLDVKPDGNFDPVPLARGPAIEGADSDEQPLPEEPLPDAVQREFADRFQRLPGARAHYALGGGWYMLVPNNVRAALDVVHKKQKGSSMERGAFIANPHERIKQALGPTVSEAELDQIFVETPQFLSARVQCLGEWSPKLCAYVPSSGQQWLPDESLMDDPRIRIPVGDSLFSVALKSVDEIIEQLESALQEGRTEIEVDGERIPATEEALAALENLAERRDKVVGPKSPAGKKTGPLVPQVIDNLDEVGYVAKVRQTRGAPGGLPLNLKTKTLFPHQKAGLQWLQEHWCSGSPGALLADDMGLGKTLQTLAFLAWIAEQMDADLHPRKPFLIVAPTGLLRNWEAEATKHLISPGLGQLIRAFGVNLRELTTTSLRQRTKQLQTADWVLTTYETLRDKVEVFLPVDWAVVCFDEAQKIKNPASRMTEMAKSLKSDFALMLTGTPVENTLADLWSIVDTCRPGELGSLKEFTDRYQKPAEAQESLDSGRDLRARLEEKAAPAALLRRMKEDHLDGLPEKKLYQLPVTMEKLQSEAYSRVIDWARGVKGDRGTMLKALQDLRKVSLLPESIRESGITDEVIDSSARLKATLSILGDVYERGEKALVFVDYLDVQEALAVYLHRVFGMKRPPLRINGQVAGSTRQRHVNEFQSKNGFDVMLLSPKAGGVGLTLTAANNVVHLSRWWNPAVEDQCTDRVFRIGQERSVNVYYPLALHPTYGEKSFDMNLHALLEKKRELSRSVLAPPDLSANDLSGLLDDSC